MDSNPIPPSTTTTTSGITGFTDRPSRPRKRNNLVIIIIVVVILAALGFLAYKRSQSKSKTNVTVTESPTQEPTQEPTKEPTPEASGSATPTKKPTSGVVSSAKDLTIEVLNGSGKEGAASGVKDYLDGKGYKNLTTGNADNFNYEGITVRIKSSQKKYLEAIESDLKSKYTLSASGSGTLAESAKVDASVIVGK